MVFSAAAENRKFLQYQKEMLTWIEIRAGQNNNAGNPILKRIVHSARDHVPLCGTLQILIIGIPRSFGALYWKHQTTWRFPWDSLLRLLPHHSAG